MKWGKNSSFILETIRELIKEAKCGWWRATQALMRDMKWGRHNKVGALHAESPPQCQNISEGCWKKTSLISKVFRTEDITEMKSLRKALRARAILHRAAATESLLMGGVKAKLTHGYPSAQPTLTAPAPRPRRAAVGNKSHLCKWSDSHSKTQTARAPSLWLITRTSPAPWSPSSLPKTDH